MDPIFSNIVGNQFRPKDSGARELVDNLQPGDEIQLERDPTNEYDSNAVKIIIEGVFVGFVAKADNFQVASHLDANRPYKAVCVAQYGDRKPGIKIELLEEDLQAGESRADGA